MLYLFHILIIEKNTYVIIIIRKKLFRHQLK